jgi:hypothetical protein
MAGTGKSTIAHTVARYYFNKRRLAASLFFSRGGGDIGNARKFVTTIVVQLARHFPPVQRYTCDAVTEHSNTTSQSSRISGASSCLGCFQSWETVTHTPSYVVVIDALDEYEGEIDIRIILRLLAEAQSLKKVRLPVFVNHTRFQSTTVSIGFLIQCKSAVAVI